jgi:thymidylate synthase
LEELLWFARGETDVTELQKRGVHIWDGNSSRAFLDSVGLHGNADGDIGPGYGFQWRHFGAEYGDGPKAGDFTKYAGQGVDQLAYVEHLLKTDPFSRRIVMTAWNPAALNRTALPPCHTLVQFYVEDVDGDRRLSCHMYQRSVDTFLGFPWNIASYAMLTHLLAVRNNMTAFELIISTGDTHLYADHFDAARQQLVRAPLPIPRIEIDPSVAHKKWEDIDSKNDVAVVGYYCHPVISAKMSA